jgi:hypothetical protein
MINILEHFILLSKVGLRIGIAETYQARLGTLRCMAKNMRMLSQPLLAAMVLRAAPQATPGAADPVTLQRYAVLRS